jgi:hypothetical protein
MQQLQQNQVNPNQPPGYNPFGGSQAPPGMSPLPPTLPGSTVDLPVG